MTQPNYRISSMIFSFFFFNDTATTEIYTLSLHDALPISDRLAAAGAEIVAGDWVVDRVRLVKSDRKSTRLNSSHSQISYAVFCLKKKTRKCRDCLARSRSAMRPLGNSTSSELIGSFLAMI